jgi:tetrachlorobenzoquinone reductase
MPAQPDLMSLRVQAVRYEAEDILSYELRRADGGKLPSFTAGAHVDLTLPNGLVRSYSISSDQSETGRYVIGVSRDRCSRGGSEWIHKNVRPGDFLAVTPPRNNFALAEDAPHTVLIAGGIGITPLLSMIRRLTALSGDWELHFAVRSRVQAAFLGDLAALAGDSPERVHLHADDEHGGGFLDVPGIVRRAPDGTQLYCCGPAPMLAAFEKAAGHLPAGRRHVEYFANDQAPAASGGFEVELTDSGVTLSVQTGATILQTLLDAGIEVPFSCTEGICGTCETQVISGVPDHRDLVLSDQEKAANDVMMICCSGSKTPRLVLKR